MHEKHKPDQILALEKTLQKVKSGKGKFVSHEIVTQWLKSWGADNEIKVPSNFKLK